MKFKLNKRRRRAAQRACRHCAAVEAFMLPEGPGSCAEAPCAKCGRLLKIDLSILEPQHRPALAALIRALEDDPDVCVESFHIISEGEPMPEGPPHPCERSHIVMVKETIAKPGVERV